MLANNGYDKSAEVVLDILNPIENATKEKVNTSLENNNDISSTDEWNIFRSKKKLLNFSNFNYYVNNSNTVVACLNNEKLGFEKLISAMISEINAGHIVTMDPKDNRMKIVFQIYRPIHENVIFKVFFMNIIKLIKALNNAPEKPFVKSDAIIIDNFEISIINHIDNDQAMTDEDFNLKNIYSNLKAEEIYSFEDIVKDDKIVLSKNINATIILSGLAKNIFTLPENYSSWTTIKEESVSSDIYKNPRPLDKTKIHLK